MTSEQAQALLRERHGMCGEISPNGLEICILPTGHAPNLGHDWNEQTECFGFVNIDECAEHFKMRPPTIEELVNELAEARSLRERVTALLALPANASVESVAEAVRICVRRCEQLELECLRLKGEV